VPIHVPPILSSILTRTGATFKWREGEYGHYLDLGKDLLFAQPQSIESADLFVEIVAEELEGKKASFSNYGHVGTLATRK
jgi:hypothetical protein